MGRRARRINLILTLGAFGLLIVLFYFNRKSLTDTWITLQSIALPLLLLLPLLQFISHFFIASAYQAIFKIYGYHVPLSRTLPMVWALNFVNQILPSGGLSGLTYLIYGTRGHVPASTATLAQLARYVLSYFSYAIVLITAFVFLIVGNEVTRRSILLVIWLVAISLILFIIFALLSTNTSRVRKIIKWIGRVSDGIFRLFNRTKKGPSAKVVKTLEEFYGDFRQITRARGKLFWPLVFMSMSTLFEQLIVYCAFLIVGADINPGIVMISFALANGIGVLSVVPGDVGVHETAMIAALSAAGVPVSVALSGTLLYRVFNKALFWPVGFVSYSKLLKPLIPERKLRS